jgi:hypothetical protein
MFIQAEFRSKTGKCRLKPAQVSLSIKLDPDYGKNTGFTGFWQDENLGSFFLPKNIT